MYTEPVVLGGGFRGAGGAVSAARPPWLERIIPFYSLGEGGGGIGEECVLVRLESLQDSGEVRMGAEPVEIGPG